MPLIPENPLISKDSEKSLIPENPYKNNSLRFCRRFFKLILKSITGMNNYEIDNYFFKNVKIRKLYEFGWNIKTPEGIDMNLFLDEDGARVSISLKRNSVLYNKVIEDIR